MALLPLGLGINIDGAIILQSRKEDESFLRLQKKILSRDNYTCLYCGFRAEEFQEVVNIDGDYQNNQPDNLATACVFCAHTQLLGLKNNSKIIYLPDISQVDLNNFIRVLFCSTYFGENTKRRQKH